MTKKKNTGGNTGTTLAIGAGLVAAAAAGYFLFGPHAKKNKKQIKSWTLKAKGEVLEKIEKMQDVSKETYAAAVSEVAEKYARIKDITPDEIKAFAGELTRHWGAIARDHAPKKKTVKKTVQKAAPKTKARS